MPTGVVVNIKFSKFKLDRGKFIKAVSDKIIRAMMLSGQVAFRMAYNLVPVWTGESRGSLRAIPRALDAPDIESELMSSVYNGIAAVYEQRRKKSDWKRKNSITGRTKGPFSGDSIADAPIRVVGNKIVFKFFSNADGFRLGDKRAIKNSPTSPWGFSKIFARNWKRLLKAQIELDRNIRLSKFSTQQRMTVRV